MDGGPNVAAARGMGRVWTVSVEVDKRSDWLLFGVKSALDFQLTARVDTWGADGGELKSDEYAL